MLTPKHYQQETLDTLRDYFAWRRCSGPGTHSSARPTAPITRWRSCPICPTSACLSEVKWWVRNLERRPDHALWLPAPSDRFDPDFVALLKDGRTLAAEYKGGQLLGGPDAREKEAVGKLWEGRSGGKCVFRLVSADDYEAHLRAVADQ